MNVALIGSGSWGTAVAGLAAARAERVTMWAHSEQTAAGINAEHRNPRYLVGYELPDNVVATTDLAQALNGADVIIFAVPSTHPLAKRRKLALSELANEVWIGWDERLYPGRRALLLESAEAARFRPCIAQDADMTFRRP